MVIFYAQSYDRGSDQIFRWQLTPSVVFRCLKEYAIPVTNIEIPVDSEIESQVFD